MKRPKILGAFFLSAVGLGEGWISRFGTFRRTFSNAAWKTLGAFAALVREKNFQLLEKED